MRKPETKLNIVTDERFFRREVCGVRIVEHEVITRVRTSHEKVARPSPRLIVTDAINATRDFVSKRRSEFRELDAFLKSVVHN